MAARKQTSPAFGYGFQPPSVPEAKASQDSARPNVPAPGAVPVGLVDDDGAAAFFGCSKRTFGDFMTAEWMPRPIRLGPRLRRWSIDELRAAVSSMPRETARQPQPSALRTRINALKSASEAAHAS